MPLKVRYNHLGAVARRMPIEIDEGVSDVAEALTRKLKVTLWRDTGMIRRVTSQHDREKFHAEVWIGYYLGKGFYSGFQEFGVASRGIAPRPIVVPTAHQHERQYHLEMAEHVRKACEAR
jgi:hypothetical protein